jgi:hypothetical protein
MSVKAGGGNIVLELHGKRLPNHRGRGTANRTMDFITGFSLVWDAQG